MRCKDPRVLALTCLQAGAGIPDMGFAILQSAFIRLLRLSEKKNSARHRAELKDTPGLLSVRRWS